MAKLLFVLLAIGFASVAKSASAAAISSGIQDASIRDNDDELIGGFVLFRRDSSSGKMEYLLLEKDSEPGDWSPPKGHVEKDLDEIPVDAAFREMREETTLLPQHYSPMLGFFEYFEYETSDDIKKLVSLWPAELTALDHPIVLSEESRDYKWADTTETLQIVKKQYKQAFVNILQKLACHFDSNAC